MKTKKIEIKKPAVIASIQPLFEIRKERIDKRAATVNICNKKIPRNISGPFPAMLLF